MKQLIARLKKLLTGSKGFTLIELLIVIAILGVLAGIVLVAVDPSEQLNRGKDAKYFNSVGTIASAWQSYLTSQAATTYPAATSTWQTTLVNAGELSALIAGNSTVSCGPAGNKHSDVCYATFNTNADAMVWITLNSKSNATKAGNGTACVAPNVAAYVWSSTLGKAGLACINATTPAQPGTVY